MTASDTLSANPPANAVYRAFWRWHFYAGLLVMPILMLMALTGGLYLFKDEIEHIQHRSLMEVAPVATSTSPQAWGNAALAAVPGRLAQLTPPAGDTQSARLIVERDGGVRTEVFVDPHTAQVLGAIPEDGLMQVVKRLHSLDIAGPVFNLLIEVVAGWAIVMVATGIVLWWPRGNGGGVVTVRATPAKRVFWRDLHAVTGIFAGAIIVFLAVTGMPWSAVWGKEVRKFTTEAGWGRPAIPASLTASGHDPAHAGHGPDASALPWTLQETTVHNEHAGHGATVTLDDAVVRFDDAGLPRPYTIAMPANASTAWSASSTPDQVEQMRTVYLDSASGNVIADIGYGEFGPAAKAIEWGISVHQGKQFGLGNKLVMLAGCVAVWLLGISALTMWWKRRPKGRLAAPARPVGLGSYVGLAAVIIPLGLIYPLVGATLFIAVVIELSVQRVVKFRTPA